MYMWWRCTCTTSDHVLVVDVYMYHIRPCTGGGGGHVPHQTMYMWWRCTCTTSDHVLVVEVYMYHIRPCTGGGVYMYHIRPCTGGGVYMYHIRPCICGGGGHVPHQTMYMWWRCTCTTSDHVLVVEVYMYHIRPCTGGGGVHVPHQTMYMWWSVQLDDESKYIVHCRKPRAPRWCPEHSKGTTRCPRLSTERFYRWNFQNSRR